MEKDRGEGRTGAQKTEKPPRTPKEPKAQKESGPSKKIEATRRPRKKLYLADASACLLLALAATGLFWDGKKDLAMEYKPSPTGVISAGKNFAAGDNDSSHSNVTQGDNLRTGEDGTAPLPDGAVPADDFHLEITFSNAFSQPERNYEASEKLAQMITEKTDGHVTVTYYGRNDRDCFADSVAREVKAENWMGLEEPSQFADYVADAVMVIAPMLYSSNDEYRYAMESDFVANLIDELAAQGIHVLDTHYSFGFRSLFTNRNISRPEELRGCVLRTASSELFTETVACWGATPKLMPFAEVTTALFVGQIDGLEGPLSTLAGADKLYESVKKVTATNHLIATRWLFISEDCWQTIHEKYQRIIEDCAYECGMWEQTMCEEDEAAQIQSLKSQGVTWTDVDLYAFAKACTPAVDWIAEEYGANRETYDRIASLVTEYRMSGN